MIKMMQRLFYLLLITPCLIIPVVTAKLTGENEKFSKIFQGEWPGNSIPTGEGSRKQIEDNVKIRRSKLTNTMSIQKQRSCRITFKCQKSL